MSSSEVGGEGTATEPELGAAGCFVYVGAEVVEYVSWSYRGRVSLDVPVSSDVSV